MESIIDYLKRRLRDAGPGRWTPIAAAAGVAKTLPRKIVYGDRENPGVQTVQPLLDFFSAVDRGEQDLPDPLDASPHASDPVISPPPPEPRRRVTDQPANIAEG